MAKAKKVGLPDFVKSKFDNHFVEEISARTRTPVIRNIPIDKLVTNTLQPRKDFGDLMEMADSIKEKGILEPVLIRPRNEKFEIVAGERRYRAAKLAGLTQIPCIEHDIADNEALELSIIENIQRKDLSIYEQAFSLKSLNEIYGYTHQEIAQKIGKSRVTVTELIRITDLPEEILKTCAELNITSKTFLLELVKLNDVDEMIEMLNSYSEKPFSRDKIKEKRKGKEEEEEEVKEETEEIEEKEPSNKTLRYNVISEDKAVKIKFDIKSGQTDKSTIIKLLEKLIADIKADKINEFNLN
jgi:ParB family chromosome partitioning protein